MKHLLIGLLTLACLPAFAGNGSGTMGIVLSEAQKFDLKQTPVIRFDRITQGNKIELTQLIEVDGETITFKQLEVKPKDLSPLWKEALKQSSANQSWQLIVPEAEDVE